MAKREDTVQPGSRPSKIQLARYATGQLEDPERDQVGRWLADNPEGREFLTELEAARDRLGDLDSSDLEDTAGPPPSRGFRSIPLLWLLPVLVVLVGGILLLAMPLDPVPQSGGEGPVIVLEGDAALQLYSLQDEVLKPYAGDPLGPGDVLGFKVDASVYDGVVLMGISDTGTVSVFFPEEGAESQPVEGTGAVPLPGTVVLEEATGDQVFVAVFGKSVGDAHGAVDRVLVEEGTGGLVAWAEGTPWADAVLVERR